MEKALPGFTESAVFSHVSRLAKSKYFGLAVDAIVLVCVCVEFAEVNGISAPGLCNLIVISNNIGRIHL